MCRNRLRLARPLEHKQLRENSNRLEINGKSPHDLRQGEAVIEHEGKEDTGSEQVLDLECVNGWVVRGPIHTVSARARRKHMHNRPEAELHEIEDVTAASNEEDLHDKIVQGDPAEEEVDVAHEKDEDVERLCLERNACKRCQCSPPRARRDAPRHDLVVCILCTRMNMEVRWAKSPVRPS